MAEFFLANFRLRSGDDGQVRRLTVLSKPSSDIFTTKLTSYV